LIISLEGNIYLRYLPWSEIGACGLLILLGLVLRDLATRAADRRSPGEAIAASFTPQAA
jgi:hypothetical protein